MSTRRLLFIAVAILFVVVALADALGAFDEEQPYVEVPHGSHSHYIPTDCLVDVDAGNFPTAPPQEDEPFSCAQFGLPTVESD